MARALRDLRGWGLHDSRICIDNLAVNDGGTHSSSYSQTAGKPGTAVPDDPLGTYLPRAHHAQEQDLTVVAIRPGIPGADTGAGLGVRGALDADEETLGWSEPNLVQGYRPVDWTTTALWQDVSTVTCPRSQKVIALGRDTAATEDPSIWVWDPPIREWTAIGEIDAGEFTGDLCGLCLLRETGRILAVAIGHATNLGVVYFSDDDGTTWAEYSRPFFEIEDGTKVRLLEDGTGNLLALCVDESSGDYQQYASRDSGATFELVETGTAWGQDPTIGLTATGRIVLTYLGFSDDFPYAITLDDAFDPVSEQLTPELLEGVTTSALASVVDADGNVYAIGSGLGTDIVRAYRSVDDGATFEAYSYDVIASGGSVADPTDHEHRIRALASSGGELLGLLNSVHATAPSTDGSLVSVILGGWATVEASLTHLRRQRFGWCYTAIAQDLDGVFLPTETLENQGWAHTGAPQALSAGYHRFFSSGALQYSRIDFAGNATDDCHLLFEVQVELGGDLADDRLSVLHLRRDGANEKALRLRFAEDGFAVHDDDSTLPALLATVSLDMTVAPIQFLVLYGTERRVTVYYRERSSSIWIEAAQAQLGITATATATDQLTVGVMAVGTCQMLLGVIAFAGSDGVDAGIELVTGLTKDGLYTNRLSSGKALGTRPYPVRDRVDADGRTLHLSGSGGSARLQETWQIPAEWDHGVADLDPCRSPSPAGGWRSRDSAEQILVWDLQADTRLGSSWSLFAAFVNCNFYTALIEASTDAAPDVWVELGTYDGFETTGTAFAGVPFTAKGDTVRPGTGAAENRYYAAGQLRGGSVVYDPSGTPVTRRIVWNSAGWLRDSGLQCVIRVEGIDGTEPATGVMYLVANGGVAVMHLEAAALYRRYRLRITEQETAEGFYELGSFLLGALVVPGRQWSRGWSVRHIPITREESDESGTLYVDARGSDESLSVMREHTFSWQDGYDETYIRAGTAPYLAANGSSLPLAADQDVALQLAGLMRESQGGATPSVVLLEIPEESSTVRDRGLWSYGRLRGVLQSNQVQGDEGSSTVNRVEQLIHTELV